MTTGIQGALRSPPPARCGAMSERADIWAVRSSHAGGGAGAALRAGTGRVGGVRTSYSCGVDPEVLVADLDADQRAAVTAESHLVAVIAGAGSGKTRVLTRRIAYRIATESAEARHTLALTFTREAAGEMRKRLMRLGSARARRGGHVPLGDARRPQATVAGHRTPAAHGRLRPATAPRRRDRCRGPPEPVRLPRRDRLGVGEGNRRRRRTRRAARRSQRHPAPGIDSCAKAYTDFQILKRRRGVIDFDDVLAHTIRDLRRDNEFADSVRWRYRHLLVDEAQDLNPLQHAIVDLLRAGRDDLFLVGDPAQAIYGFNGADPTLLVEVESQFPGIEIIRLPVNHRSTPQIVAAGVHVLDSSGQPGRLVSDRADGPPARVVRRRRRSRRGEARRSVRAPQRSEPGPYRRDRDPRTHECPADHLRRRAPARRHPDQAIRNGDRFAAPGRGSTGSCARVGVTPSGVGPRRARHSAAGIPAPGCAAGRRRTRPRATCCDCRPRLPPRAATR